MTQFSFNGKEMFRIYEFKNDIGSVNGVTWYLRYNVDFQNA